MQHVQCSTRRPSCRRKVVPLHFVLNPQESFRRFLNGFNKICHAGHVFREVGAYYFLTRDSFIRKFHGSLEPPLGSAGNPQDPEPAPSENLVQQLSVIETEVSLEMDTPPEGAENEANKAGMDATPSVMLDSTTTLVSTSGDYFDTESDSLMMKTSKRRFESGSTSIPGKTGAVRNNSERIRYFIYSSSYL